VRWLLSAAGVRLEDVADVMGHRSTRTTSAVYRHVVVPTINAGQRPAERLFA
jgi:integrase